VTGRAATQGAPTAGLVKRLIFWDIRRTTWPYDLVVGLILIFIFATPREFFHDQPKPSSVVLLSSGKSADQVFIATDLLEAIPPSQRAARAQTLIRERTGKNWHVTRVVPIRDNADQEIKGFLAYTTP
jgi:hypothetical protein